TLLASSARRSADTQAPGRGAVFKHETRRYLKLFPYGSKFLKASPPTVRSSAENVLCVKTSDSDCSSHKERYDVNRQAMPSAERTGRSLGRASSHRATGPVVAGVPPPGDSA